MVTNQTTSIATSANDIRDIKPPFAIPSGWEWLWWVLTALAVAAAGIFAWRWWQKRKANMPVEPPVPPHVRAKQKLEEALALIAQPKPFCILVSDTIRVYLEERFNFRAPERTTEEFLHELQDTDLLSPEQKESLGNFLESCDLVKFAKYEPGEPELRELHGSAVKLVEETEPVETETEMGSTRVPRVASGVTPDASTMPTASAKEFDKQSFRRDAENSTPEARAPQSEIVNRKS